MDYEHEKDKSLFSLVPFEVVKYMILFMNLSQLHTLRYVSKTFRKLSHERGFLEKLSFIITYKGCYKKDGISCPIVCRSLPNPALSPLSLCDIKHDKLSLVEIDNSETVYSTEVVTFVTDNEPIPFRTNGSGGVLEYRLHRRLEIIHKEKSAETLIKKALKKDTIPFTPLILDVRDDSNYQFIPLNIGSNVNENESFYIHSEPIVQIFKEYGFVECCIVYDPKIPPYSEYGETYIVVRKKPSPVKKWKIYS